MVKPDWVNAPWRKSVRSGGSGECVEFAHLDDQVGIRDSYDPDGPVLVFDRGCWTAFIAGLRRGEFDG